MPPHARLSRHWAARVLAGLAVLAVFVAALGAGVVLHGNLPIARRLASRVIQDAVTHALGGKFVLAPIEQVGLSHVVVADVKLLDAGGHPVLELSQVRIDLSLGALVREFFFGSSGGVLLNHVEVGRAVITLLADQKTGEPTLVRAISPSASATPSAKATGGGAEIVFPSIEIGTAIVRTRLPALPELEARLRSVRGAVRGGPNGVAVDVQRFGIAVHGASVPARGTGTFALRAPGPLQTTFDGFIGDVELRVSATLDGSHVDVAADAPHATPRAVRALSPGWPLTEAVSAHLAVRGDLPNLTVSGRFQAGAATLVAEGSLVTGKESRATLTVTGRHLDARAVDVKAPATDLPLDGTLDARVAGAHYTAEVTAHTGPSSILGNPVPGVDARATVVDGTAKGTFDVHEPGLPVAATFEVRAGPTIDVDARTPDVPLAGISRLALTSVRGRGRARVQAHLEGKTVRVTVDADVGGVASGDAALGRAHLQATLSGPAANPTALRGSARLEGSSVLLSGVDADKLVIEARGSPAALAFDAELARSSGPSLKAKGTARLTPEPTLERTRVLLEQGPVRIEGDVVTLDVEKGSADIQNLSVTGAGGNITGAVRIAAGLLELNLEGEGVDLDALSRAVGVPRGELSGTLRVSTNLVVGRDVTRGQVRLGLGNATLGPVGGLALSLSADLDGHHLTGDVSGLVLGLGTFGATWDENLDGTPLALLSYRRATGHAEVQVGEVRLALLGALLPKDAPLSGILGRAFGRVVLERKAPETELPSVFATVSTRDLVVTVPAPGRDKPLRVAGMDVTTTGQFEGTTGDGTGSVLVTDAHGDVLSATGAVRIDVARLLREPARALAQLVDTPIEMVVTMPSRKLTDLPEPLPKVDLAGSVGGVASLRGTLAKPTVFVRAQGEKLGATIRPVDVHAEGQYDFTTRAISARAAAEVTGRDAAVATLRGSLPDGPDSFRGSARVDLYELPLEALGLGGERAMSGSLAGNATLARDDAGGSIRADIQIKDALVEHASLGEGELHLSTTGTLATGTLAFRSPRGTLEANGSLPLTWSGPVPALGDASPIRAHAVLHDFAAVAVSPAVTGVLSRIGGRLDADLSMEFSPAAGGSWSGGVDGKASLREGAVLVDAFGLEVNDLSATAEAHGKGSKTTVAIHDIVGRVRSSKENLHGQAELSLDGVRVTTGTAQLDAADMPILFRGAPQGRITGRAEARLTREPERMQVDIDVPRLVTALPQASARQVEDLRDHPDISVVQLEQATAANHVTLPWRLSFHLGSEVSLRRADVDLNLTGSPVMTFGDEAEASGSVALVPGGRIPVLGKVFSVEQGAVVFDTGDPGNPRVALRAVWHAPNESLVFVEVTGTMRDAKIALRSEPPLSQPEVFALLLGGSSSDASVTSDQTLASSAGNSAVALANVATAVGMNQLVANNPVELRVDTTAQSQPRYTAAVRVRPNLWFEASEYQQSDYGVGGSTDRNVFSGTVDYRFTQRWSLRTEVGTAGGAMDLLWQYRY